MGDVIQKVVCVLANGSGKAFKEKTWIGRLAKAVSLFRAFSCITLILYIYLSI